MIESSSCSEWCTSALARSFTSFSAPESVIGIANEPRFGVPTMTSLPPRPLPLASSIAFQVSGKSWMKRRETSPPIECATRCTGSPAPNAWISPSSRAALLSMSSRQSNGNGRTCQRVSSSMSSGTYVLRWTPAGRTWTPGRADSPSAFNSRSPIRPAIRRTKLIQMRSESPLRSTASSSVPMIPGRTTTLPSFPRRRPRAAALRARSNASWPISCSSRRCSSASSETRTRRAVSRSARSSAAWSSSSRGVSGRVTTSVPRREGAQCPGVRPRMRATGAPQHRR